MIKMTTTAEATDGWLTTLCDWPERYRGADGIEALRALPAVWKNTMPVAGECGEFYAVVRETFDGRFYFAGLTVSRRSVDLTLDFLGEGEWQMDTFADDPARTSENYTVLRLGSSRVSRRQTVSFDMVDEGGAVAIFSRLL